MRAPWSLVSPVGFLLCSSAALVLGQDDEPGYIIAEDYQDDAFDDVTDGSSACPSEQRFRVRETCNIDGVDVPCIRMRCCDDYVHISGRCIHKSIEPCSLRLCEQACEVKEDKMWCTCKPGFRFDDNRYKTRIQPYCIDVDECLRYNGGCEHSCVNDPGGYHCECSPPFLLAGDGRSCQRPMPMPMPMPLTIAPPLPLIRASSSRCFAPCDTVTRLARRVKQLADQLQTMHVVLKKLVESSAFGDADEPNFPEGESQHRVLDSMAPLEGGYCRCERGPRGPAGAPGMEGPKGDAGPRGPRGARGPAPQSMDFVLLLVNELRHDVTNLEQRVYTKGEEPDRFDVQKAWRRHRKQEIINQGRRSEQGLAAYTAPSLEVHATETEPTSDHSLNTVKISPNGLSGEIHHQEATTEMRLKAETEPFDIASDGSDFPPHVEEQLRKLKILANVTMDDEEDDLADFDYSFY